MIKRKYAGTWTAIITPFGRDGSVDEAALKRIVRRQIENGVTGIVPCGTTGESPTTTHEEDCRIFKLVVEGTRLISAELGRKVMVMPGTGSNCTRDAVEYTRAAKDAGADCCLVVTPYYNKPTQKGLLMHFNAVADVGLPVIVYNIKGRCGINIDTDTLMKIAAHPMVVGVKEASGDLAQMKEVLERRVALEAGGKEFTVLCGDDGLTLELMKMREDGGTRGRGEDVLRTWGGDGVISVAANLVPDKVAEMVEYALDGNFEEAAKLNEHFARFFKDIFVEANPIPVKYIASRMGLCELAFRLPMCEPTEKTVEYLAETMKFYNLK